MAQDTELQALVAQHFAKLDKILLDTVNRLNAMRDQIPEAVRQSLTVHPLCPHCKEPHPEWIFSCDKAREYVANELALQQATLLPPVELHHHPYWTDEGAPLTLAFMEGQKHYTAETIPSPVPHTSDGNCVCDGDTP